MKLSIVIPTYNQGEFLEACLNSVWSQRGLETELIIIDGGSTDETPRILEKNTKRISFWSSERDSGQTDAINKGLRKITGDWWMYLNSDDALSPGALESLGTELQKEDEAWIAGAGLVKQGGKPDWILSPAPIEKVSDLVRPWSRANKFIFPFSGSSIMHRRVLDKVGFFDESLHFSMDIEYYVRAWLRGGFRPQRIPDVLSIWNRQPASKTERQGIAWGFREDEIAIAERYESDLPEMERRALQRELVFEKKMLICRKALSMEGSTAAGLARKACVQPGLLFFRPWWGEMRRLLQSK